MRKARIEDAASMARVIAEVAPEGLIGTEPPVDVEERAQRFRRLIGDPGPAAAWVLEDNSRVVGNAGVYEQVRGVLELGMAILPPARGRGGGRALLDAMIDHGRASGAHKLELQVWVDNAPAVALYASAGFEVEGVKRDHYLRSDGTLRSALVMALRLRHDGVALEQADDRDHADDDDHQSQCHRR